ncbi:hypothetical protein [Streptacidiphilus sp. MAP12-16]|uniref:hypothetical protein n=1 Tax=Streptacidiphilus sp. MAP12-16 TaxID=3156300 RepID=UPI003517214F
MTAGQQRDGNARLLPWTTDDGGACYLDGSGGGFLAALAENVECAQLASGAQVLEHSRRMCSRPGLAPTELRFLVSRLAESLADVLRVAESRGLRLGIDSHGDTENGPDLSTAGECG